jgi:biotin carboxyl carrier protein
MKLSAEIEGEKNEIDVTRDADGGVRAEIDGRGYRLEISEPEANIYLLKHEGRIYEVFVAPEAKPGDPFQIRIGSSSHEIRIVDPKRLRGTGAGTGAAEGTAELRTAMPGKVVRVLLAENAEVKAGEAVIVVEAMKMQNEMKSSKDGTVREIRFKEGDTVNAGDVLAVIE